MFVFLRGMNIEDLREYCLSMPFATERCPFGPEYLATEIGGKMFCLIDLTGQRNLYNIKVHPDLAISLVERFADIIPGYHMNKRHWVSIPFANNLPADLERRLIRHSYRQTALGLPRCRRPELPPDEPIL